MKPRFAAALLLAISTLGALGTAQAQVRKCVGPDGKITYSDALCAKDTANEAGVKINANTIDASGSREDARKYRNDKLLTQAMQQNPNKCKFSVDLSDQSNGKPLADAASKECFLNIVAEDAGQPQLSEAYKRWYENQQLTLGQRNAAAAEQRQKEADQREKEANCRADQAKGISCRK